MRRCFVTWLAILCLVAPTGCTHLPDTLWPFTKTAAPVNPVVTPPVAEIGPRVEAVPVEPVISENMMAPAEPAAPVIPDEPFAF